MKRKEPRVAQQEKATLTFTPEELTELAYRLAAADTFLGRESRLLNRVLEALVRFE